MTRTLTIPIRTYSAAITLQLPEHTMSEHDWGVLMDVLAAMKPALVEQVVDAQVIDDEEQELATQHARELAFYAANGTVIPRWWHGAPEAWGEHVAQLVRRYSEGA